MGGANGENVATRPRSRLRLIRGTASDADRALDVRPREADVLVVSASRPVTDVVSDWRDATGDLPAGFGLVTFADMDRSVGSGDAANRPSRRALPGANVTLTAMSDAGNLQRLGTAVTLYLDDWADSGRETLVYVDALAPFVAANGVEQTFQFLHLLMRSVEGADGSLTARLDPSRTEERTVNTLTTLFDEVIEDPSDTSTLDVDTVHDLLGNARRRFVLRTLFEESEIGLDRLTTRLARWECETDDPTPAERDRAYTALASIHVPRLVEAGVVTFDRVAERVRLSEVGRNDDRLERFLDWPPEE